MRGNGIEDYGTLYTVLFRAWEEFRNTGSATIQPGVFIEKGKDIPRGEGEEPLDGESCYLTTDSGTEPIWISGFGGLFDKMAEILGLED